jgi:phage terminase large subunit-like protein
MLAPPIPHLPVAQRSPEERLASLPPAARREWLLEQSDDILDDIRKGEWWWKRRAKQIPPDGNWFVWIVGSGRGWGKGRVGSETLIENVLKHPRDRHGNPTEWLVVGETYSDTQDINVNGPSGILKVLLRKGYSKVRLPPADGAGVKCFTYVKSPKPVVTVYPDGQKIMCEGADDEDVGRGYNLAGAWLDELAKWGPVADGAWKQGIMPAMRADLIDDRPRVIVTTTPKPIGLLKEWYTRARSGDPAIRLTIGATYENAANLNPDLLDELLREYEGTRAGRQEIYGELLDEMEGALWTRDLIDNTRWKGPLPPLVRVVVGVDPAGTGQGDEMGCVVMGADANDHQYVLADVSKRLAGLASGRHAWKVLLDAQRWMPDPDGYATPRLIVEEDYGKQWLKDVLSVVYESMKVEGSFSEYDRPPIEFVKASMLGGKQLRAEPVATRYEVGRVHHVGVFPGLEDQMCVWEPLDPKAKSPDRVDAMVHASLWLRKKERRRTAAATAADNMRFPIGGASGV